jgi:methylase of polypeptide subunit release factors
VQSLRAGPVDHELFGLQVRLFPSQNPGDRRALFAPDHFDRAERNFILQASPHNGVFLDIGANIGVYSLFVGAKRPDVLIIAFEPSPLAFEKLRFNIQSNGRMIASNCSKTKATRSNG